MRIVLATTAAAPGGVWRHVCELGRGLRDDGHDVRVALRPAADRLWPLADAAGLRPIGLQKSVVMRADVWHLHLHDTYDRLAIPLLAARRATGVTIASEHLPHSNASDPALLPGPRTPGAAGCKLAFKRAQARLCDRVITGSDASRDFLVGRYGLDPARIVAVAHGVDAGPPPTPPPGREPVGVVVVGSLIAQKGHDTLVRALAVSAGAWELTLVGSGPSEPALRELAGRLVAGRVRFAGWSDDHLAAIRAADVVCIPSLWEERPYVALDAAALGRPVVASAVDGIPELVADGTTGRLVAPGDPRALAGALDELAADAGLRRRLGAAGRARVIAEFPLRRMVDGTLAVYADAGRG